MKQYTQIIKGHYDEAGAVKAIDILNDKPLTAEFLKTRPDIKQRVEKAINTQTYLATYPRGTRQGFEWIEEKEINNALQDLNPPTKTPKIIGKVPEFNLTEPPSDFFIDELKMEILN
jgi:hypothetical protein